MARKSSLGKDPGIILPMICSVSMLMVNIIRGTPLRFIPLPTAIMIQIRLMSRNFRKDDRSKLYKTEFVADKYVDKDEALFNYILGITGIPTE